MSVVLLSHVSDNQPAKHRNRQCHQWLIFAPVCGPDMLGLVEDLKASGVWRSSNGLVQLVLRRRRSTFYRIELAIHEDQCIRRFTLIAWQLDSTSELQLPSKESTTPQIKVEKAPQSVGNCQSQAERCA